jgi:hypothetical protein
MGFWMVVERADHLHSVIVPHAEGASDSDRQWPFSNVKSAS